MNLSSKNHSSIIGAALFAFLIACQIAFAGELLPQAPPPGVSAASAILIDAATGQVLYEKNARERRAIASTTKIMTGLLAAERCAPDDIVTVNKDILTTNGSMLGLRPGEQYTVDALMKALLLKSANDSAVALADHMAGSIPNFARLMNQRAAQLGAHESHFVNPHGLFDPQHYSTAYDLALISREAMKDGWFRNLVGTKICSIVLPDGKEQPLINHNRLLFRNDNVDGIKTGYVKQAGRCLVASQSRGGWRLIAVVLNSGDLWSDSEALLNYGFDNWQATIFARIDRPVTTARVFGGREGRIDVIATQELAEVLPKGMANRTKVKFKLHRLVAPVQPGQEVGQALLLQDGKQIATASLLANDGTNPTWWLTTSRVLGKIILTLTILVAGLKGYGKAAKIARRRRRRLQAES